MAYLVIPDGKLKTPQVFIQRQLAALGVTGLDPSNVSSLNSKDLHNQQSSGGAESGAVNAGFGQLVDQLSQLSPAQRDELARLLLASNREGEDSTAH